LSIGYNFISRKRKKKNGKYMLNNIKAVKKLHVEKTKSMSRKLLPLK